MTTSSTEHDDLREQVGLYVLGALTPAERDAFEAHAATCAECAAQARALSAVANALAQAVPQHDPAPALRTRVVASVGGPAATAARTSRVGQRTSVLATWLTAAASLALAIALGVYAATLRGRVVALERRLHDATERARESDRQIADLRRTAADAQSQVAVFASPDLRRINLAGQTPAPQASGSAFWSRSRGLVFTASNLPPVPAGKSYQLWVLTARPAPISAGLFLPDARGRVVAVFETPVDLPTPTGMAVTIEPEAGVASPTGEKYLVGL